MNTVDVLNENSESARIEIALAITREAALSELLCSVHRPVLGDCARYFNWQALPEHHFATDMPVTRIYFGGEFCDRLIPDTQTLERVIELVKAHDLALSLLTPLVSDKGLRLLAKLCERLPAETEVIVNDWGVLRLLKRKFPELTPVVGRQLCKMIKDPRLPSAQWARLYPHGVQSGPFHNLLEQFDIGRLEMDVPPFAEPKDFDSPGRSLSVHLPFGYSVKGRMCKIGSLDIEKPRKFAPGHGCNKECLHYSAHTVRAFATNDSAVNDSTAATTDLATFQQGNTMFYRHSPAMLATVADAVAQQQVNRLVFAGDWHEDYRSH